VRAIKGMVYLGLFTFLINNITSGMSFKGISLDGLVTGFGSQMITSDNYLGICFELIIKFIFSFDLNNMSDFLKVFGV
jgi:hypothetical protein